MKITLDLTDLVSRGQLTQAEAERLKGLAIGETGALGVNILMAFGALAVSLGICILVPSVFTAIALGAVFFVVGLGLTLAREERWAVFAQICMVIGALAFIGGLSTLAGGNFWVNLTLTLLTGAAALLARSGLLMALAVLALTATAATGYTGWNQLGGATVATILVLALVAIGLYLLSLRIKAYENLLIVGARTAAFTINLAFLFGSLFGDDLARVDNEVFTVVWAVLLVGVGIWGMWRGRRWVVNTAAVFGAIHLMVQWFVFLGASPGSILGGGVLMIALGFALKSVIERGASKPAQAG